MYKNQSGNGGCGLALLVLAFLVVIVMIMATFAPVVMTALNGILHAAGF